MDLASTKDIEANRRLLFVTATRAKDELYITGQYRVGKNASDEYVNNMYLAESFGVVGKDFFPRNAEEEKAFKALEKLQKKQKVASKK